MKKKKQSKEEEELKDLFRKVEELKEKKEEPTMVEKVEAFKSSNKYKNLMNEHKRYLAVLEKKRADNIKKLKLEDKEKVFELDKKITDIKEAKEIKTNEFMSDKKFVENIDKLRWYQFIKKIKRKFGNYVLVMIHLPNNQDIIRYFPLEKNHIVNVDGNRYLYNPNHFRYMNGVPVLYFYWGNPFSKIVNVNDGYLEPTISVEAFSSILTSKFVMDAVKGDEKKTGIVFFIIILILMVIMMVLSFINLVGLQNIQKSMGI